MAYSDLVQQLRNYVTLANSNTWDRIICLDLIHSVNLEMQHLLDAEKIPAWNDDNFDFDNDPHWQLFEQR